MGLKRTENYILSLGWLLIGDNNNNNKILI